MQETRHIGLDLGVKSRSKVYIIDEAGERVRPEFYIWNTPEGLDYMMRKTLEGASKEASLDLTVEPTNSAWFGVTIYLQRKYPKVKIYRVKAEKVQDLRKFYRKHTKTDSLDARTLAKMLVVDSDSLQEVYIRPRNILALNTRCKQRTRLVKDATRKKNSISDQIELGFPHLVDCFSSKFTTPFILFCERYANPFKVRRLGKEKLARVLIKLGFRTNISTLTDNIYQRAEDACTLLGDEDAAVDYKDLQDRISSELRVFKTLEKEIGKVDDKIKELYQSCFPKKRLNSIPGIADIIGPSIASFIGDAERFSSGRSTSRLFWLLPKTGSFWFILQKGA